MTNQQVQLSCALWQAFSAQEDSQEMSSLFAFSDQLFSIFIDNFAFPMFAVDIPPPVNFQLCDCASYDFSTIVFGLMSK